MAARVYRHRDSSSMIALALKKLQMECLSDSRSDVHFRDGGLSASVILHEALHSLLAVGDAECGTQ